MTQSCVKYYNPRTRELNYNSARDFAFAFDAYRDELASRASFTLDVVAPDLAYIRNAKNRIVCELRVCTYEYTHDVANHTNRASYYFRNELQIERKL